MKLFVAIQFLLYSFCVNAQNTSTSLSNIHSSVMFTYTFKNPIPINQYFLQSPQPLPSPLSQPSPSSDAIARYDTRSIVPFIHERRHQPFYMTHSFTTVYVDPHPSIFCKIEAKLEAKSKLLRRFRLGSLNYTEWMEGKRIWLQ